MKLSKHTSLETSVDIIDTMQWKLSTIAEAKQDQEGGLADYIAFSIDNLDSQLAQLKHVKAEIAEREKALTMQIKAIKSEGSIFLASNGLDKLNGVICSSITITKGKPSSTKQKFVRDCSLDEQNDLLEQAGFGHYEDVETLATEDMLRINKRKTLVPEIE